jgi:hypothetical protein
MEAGAIAPLPYIRELNQTIKEYELCIEGFTGGRKWQKKIQSIVLKI